MTPLLIFSFLCVAIGVGMIFWHQSKIQTDPSKTGGDEDKFPNEMLSALKEYYPDVPFRYNASQDMIEPPDSYDGEHQYKFFLGNLRNRARDMGTQDRQNYIRQMIMTFTDRSDITAEELKSALYLRARTPSELILRNILLDGPEREGGTIAAVQRGDIILETVMDIDNAVRVIDQETLTEHGLNIEDAFNVAASNLLRMTPDDGDALWEKVAEHVWISKLNDDYDAARLFTFPEQMRLPFKSPATAYAPAHAILLITDRRDEDTLGRMVEFGNNAAEMHRPLSYALWGQIEAGWERLTSGERGSAIGKAALVDDNTAYAEQKNILEQIFEKKEKDIFVASVMTYQTDEGDIFTTAVLIDGHTYLPKVDQIVLQMGALNKNDTTVKLDWNRFVDILGPKYLKPVPELTPIRFEFKKPLPKAIQQQLLEAAQPL